MLWLDTETYSECNLKLRGAHVYAAHPTTEVTIATWAIDDGPVKTWDATAEKYMPAVLYNALHQEDMLVTAHNSAFDRNILKHVLKIDVPLHRWRDTMHQALAHSLPGGLDKLCDILKVPFDQAKHKDGRNLMMYFCKPRPANDKVRRANRFTHPDKWAAFLAYAGADITAMREVARRLPRWNYGNGELTLWQLDQRINDKGFAIDECLARGALAAIAGARTQLTADVATATGGAVTSLTKDRDVLLGYLLSEYGVELPNLQKDTLQRRIDDDALPRELRTLLAMRLEATTTSNSKYTAALNGAHNGRLKGTAQFRGAMRTGRWAHRRFQPGNMPRPTMKQDAIDHAIEAIRGGHAAMVLPNVVEACSNAIRGCIVATPGCDLHVADLSNIEGRGAAWLANEEWKLQAFRDFDAGVGPDLYKLTYARAMGITPDVVDKAMRQIGKVMELGLGFGGGVAAFLTFAITYGLDLQALAAAARSTLPSWAHAEAVEFLAWSEKTKRSTFGLPADVFIVCDALKRMWRRANSNIEQSWYDFEDAARLATMAPGMVYSARRVSFRRDGAWLRMTLPSGRALCYPAPKVEGFEYIERPRSPGCITKGKISYMGVNQYTRQWQRINTYGGKLFENATQAFANDVFCHGLVEADRAGYECVTTIHDEALAEAFKHEMVRPTRSLEDCLASPVPWAPGLPLAAAGFITDRYRKD